MILDRWLGGVRGAVTRTAFVATGLTLAIVGVFGSFSLARLLETELDLAIEEALDDAENELRRGTLFTSFSHPSGVDILVDRPFTDLEGGEQIVVGRMIEVDGNDVTLSARVSTIGPNRSLESIRRVLWIAIPLAAAATALVANLAAGRSLRPVSEITEEARRIAARDGRGHVPIPQTGDEVQRLATTVNDMLDAAASAHERQRQFVSDASHELRTPLMVLMAEADLASRHPDSTSVQALAASVEAHAHRLDDLADDLLTQSEADERPLAPTKTNLPALVREEVDLAPLTAHVELVLVDAQITADERLIRRSISNLVINADRHAEAAIRVEVSETMNQATIAVDDDGPGIAPSDRVRVFDRFARLDEARDRRLGGTGLGLSIVHRVVTRHGGVVTMSTSPTLGGARVEITLPKLDHETLRHR